MLDYRAKVYYLHPGFPPEKSQQVRIKSPLSSGDWHHHKTPSEGICAMCAPFGLPAECAPDVSQASFYALSTPTATPVWQVQLCSYAIQLIVSSNYTLGWLDYTERK